MKIYDESVQKYLREAGVSDLEIAKIKYRELRKMVLDKLLHVRKNILDENYDYVKIEQSPAGDDMGMDNDYIDFDGWDIGDVLDELKSLKNEIELDGKL